MLVSRLTHCLESFSATSFKGLADELGMPYQHLINLYLRDCAINQKKVGAQVGFLIFAWDQRLWPNDGEMLCQPIGNGLGHPREVCPLRKLMVRSW